MFSSKYALSFTLLVTLSTAAKAQSIGPSALDAAGGSVTTGGNTYDYAIGQTVASNTFAGSSLIIMPGVLQPEISPNSVNGLSIKASELKVFPSPAEHTIWLQPAFGAGGTLQWELYAADGKLAKNGAALLSNGNEKQEVDISALAAGQYMLQINWLQAGIQYTSGYKIQKLR